MTIDLQAYAVWKCKPKRLMGFQLSSFKEFDEDYIPVFLMHLNH